MNELAAQSSPSVSRASGIRDQNGAAEEESVPSKIHEQGELNVRLRKAIQELRDTSALLRVQATTLTLANKRLLRQIKRTLRKPPFK